jgi:hypothetical protein
MFNDSISLPQCQFVTLETLPPTIENGWLVRHESGTYVKFTQAGAELLA